MKNIRLLLFLLLYDPTLKAQSPRAGGIAPIVSASLGCSFTDLEVSSRRIGLNGVDAAFTVDVSPRLGGRIDVAYVRASNVLNSGNHIDVLSYLVGPVIYPVRRGRQALFAQALLGGARETAAIPDSGGGFFKGYVNQFAFAIGTGAEFRVYESIGVRIGADYLHTRYFNPSPAITGQNDFRITVSLVHSFGRHRSN
jgi:hypothetical protein